MATSARLEELRKKFDENPRRYFAPLANEYRKQGDLAQAIALCRTHLPNQPGHISGHIVLAQALYESRELAESRQEFEQALDLDPENLIALRYLGDIAREQGAPAAAQAWYQRVLEADPRNDEIAGLIRAVESEAAAALADLASRPTPASSPAVAVEDSFVPGIDAGVETLEPVASEPPVVSSAPPAPPLLSLDWPTEPASPEQATPEPAPAESVDSWFDAPAPVEQAPATDAPAADAFAWDDPPSPADLGELEAIAEPDLSDWFTAAPAAEAAAEEEHFPDLAAARDLPTPESAERLVESFSTGIDASVPFDAEVAPEPQPDGAADMAPVAEFVVEASAPEFSAEPIEASADPAPEPVEASGATEPLPAMDLEFDSGSRFEEPVVGIDPLPAAEMADASTSDLIDLSFDDAPRAEVPGEPSHEAAPAVAAFDAFDVVDSAAAAAEIVEAPADEFAPIAHVASDAGDAAWDEVLAVTDARAEVESDADHVEALVEAAESYDPVLGRTPAFAEPVLEAPPAPFVTETMAELYLQQGFNEEALAIYRQLLQQNPDDATLQQRVAALEEGQRAPVITPLASPTQGVPPGPSVRQFFARFAQRGASPAAPEASAPEVPVATFGGAATTEEALTQPDEPAAGGLDAVFGRAGVAAPDVAAGASLAAAFAAASAGEVAPELSLDTLFGQVPGSHADAVTSAGIADSESAALAAGPDGEAHADIEQFTAWLEGLKKK